MGIVPNTGYGTALESINCNTPAGATELLLNLGVSTLRAEGRLDR